MRRGSGRRDVPWQDPQTGAGPATQASQVFRGLAGEDEVFVGFQPGAFQLQGLAPVKAATGGEVDIFDAGLDEA